MNFSDTPRKFIESYPGNGREVLTPNGYKEILEVHKTIKYPKFRIELDNGLSLECAHNHVVINKDMKEIYVEDSLNQILLTENGLSEVIKVTDLKIEEHMYDISIDSEDELYYSNGILSHNSGKSVTVGIYLSHLILYENDINIGVAAQESGMAKEFLNKVKEIFIELPIWLTPGVKSWNVKSVSFENGVRLLSDVASSNAFRGHTCLRGDTKIECLNTETNEEELISLEELYKLKTKYKIKTLNGYENFQGIKRVKESGISIHLSNKKIINCTLSHRICVGVNSSGKIFRQAKNLKINDKIKNLKIVNIVKDKEQYYYDPINVDNGTYLVQDIVHHNCTYIVTDEAAYISGNDNGTTKFNAYLDSMLPSQSSLAKKKNIFISTANGRNEFYKLYMGALTNGIEKIQKTIKKSDLDKYLTVIDLKEEDDDTYKITYTKSKPGQNGSVHFTTDWRVVPRWNQDGTPKSPEKFREEIVASKGELFFQQAYGNDFLGSSNTLISPEKLESLVAIEPETIKDNKLNIYEHPIKGHKYIMGVDPSKDGIDAFAIQIIDITNFNFKQVATAKLQIDYLLMPEFIDEWCNYYNKPYLIIENNEGAGQSVADQMYQTFEYENLHFDKISNKRKKYPGTRTTTKSRKQIIQTMKTFIENDKIEIVDGATIEEFYSFILINNKYQATEGTHDDMIMSLALTFTLFNDTKNFGDMKEITKRLFTELEETEEVHIEDLITVGSFDDSVEINDNYKRDDLSYDEYIGISQESF